MRTAERVEEAIQPFVARARARARWRGAAWGLAAGSLLWVLLVLAGQWTGTPPFWVGPIVQLVGVGTGVVLALARMPETTALLLDLDAQLGLKARISTAWELEKTGTDTPLATIQLRDALSHLAAHTPEEWIPRRLPRRVWAIVLLAALTWTPFVLFSPGFEGSAMTEAEREAIQEAARRLAAAPFARVIEPERERLREAGSIETALAALADAEKRLDERSKSAEALARTTLQNVLPPEASSLSQAVADAGPELPDALREALRTLRKRLAEQGLAPSLVDALDGIESKTVSAETLARIVEELRQLESGREADLLAALKEIRRQKKKIAAAALTSRRRGTLARLDAVPGKESDDSVAQGARLSDLGTQERGPTTFRLEAGPIGSGREARVFSRRASSEPDAKPVLLPFRDVVLSAQKRAAEAVADESLPIAYRDRIRRYFAAIGRSVAAPSD